MCQSSNITIVQDLSEFPILQISLIFLPIFKDDNKNIFYSIQTDSTPYKNFAFEPDYSVVFMYVDLPSPFLNLVVLTKNKKKFTVFYGTLFMGDIFA